MEEMRDSLESGLLKGDFDSLIENMRLAKETHDVLYMENIYHILHDMDYFLLRYGPEDVGKYTKDGGTVNKYYGVLDVYHSWAEPADETGPDQDKPGTVRVANPSWDYYIEASGETETAPLELVVLEQTKNEITDEEQWFAKEGLCWFSPLFRITGMRMISGRKKWRLSVRRYMARRSGRGFYICPPSTILMRKVRPIRHI